jgi:hypothetical protein
MQKLDFDALYEEAEAAEREGICPYCEDDAFEDGEPVEPRLLCWCGVCLKYHHDDYSHEPMLDPDEMLVP